MNEVVQEWVEKANGDFHTARRELAVTDQPNFDAVCFHAQQCIEKLMKAALIKKGCQPPKTHDLIQLSDLLAVQDNSWQADIQDLRFLNQAAVGFRYPGDSAGYEEAEEAVGICERLRTVLRSTASL